MPIILKDFQEQACGNIVARMDNVRALYDALRNRSESERAAARRRDGALVLQAPTGAGKTVIAVESMRRMSEREPILWFWFAPFAGLVEQSRNVIAAQAPELPRFDLDSDRRLDTVKGGGVFVATWASVAASNARSRLARTRSDAGQALDDVILLARAEGLRIGCVVDEAHHGFQKATQARTFFKDVLSPDYTVMMTATPRDADVGAFERATGYEVGTVEDWASISRHDAVKEGLLKRGVRLVRFLARDGDTAQLVDFEHLALRECAAMHRRIKASLADAGVPLTPLMLVQVPDGKAAQQEAQRFLVEQLGFDASAVRLHTADEPDPDLLSLANDPTVEVLVFKMAVALGFDAPRAYTLAALRGARDAAFGVQVIGRIVRRHALVQARTDLEPLLEHGYVFLANAQAQEGLLNAGTLINAMTAQAPELGTQTVVTVIGDAAQVQVVQSGHPLSLLVTPAGVSVVAEIDGGGTGAETSANEVPASVAGDDDARAAWQAYGQNLLGLSGGQAAATVLADFAGNTSDAGSSLVLGRASMFRYERRADVPDTLWSERLPPVSNDFEARLATYVDFSDSVLAARLKTQVQLRRTERDLFANAVHADESMQDIWASVEPPAVADRAEAIRARLSEANDRELYRRLLDRFRDALVSGGYEVPAEQELLMQQLDLVLVRNPSLLRDAYRRLRHAQVMDVEVRLPAELQSDVALQSALRGSFGVFPADMNPDEWAVARLLDADPRVRWWHRNPSTGAHAAGLYRWDEGAGFYPDFIVAMEDRNCEHGIALLEVKGEPYWALQSEVEKSSARHPRYGVVFMIGRRRGQSQFFHLRELQDRLQTEAPFTIDRLRFA
jgi:hypothetical protein